MVLWSAVLAAVLVAGISVDESDDGIVVDVGGDDEFAVAFNQNRL
jgi:rhamnogalacturonan endolyase